MCIIIPRTFICLSHLFPHCRILVRVSSTSSQKPTPTIRPASHSTTHYNSSSTCLELLLHRRASLNLCLLDQVLRDSRRLLPSPLSAPEPRFRCSGAEARLSRVLLKALPGNLLSSATQRRQLLQGAEILLEVLFANEKALTALLLQAR